MEQKGEPKRAEESRREPKRAEESRREPKRADASQGDEDRTASLDCLSERLYRLYDQSDS